MEFLRQYKLDWWVDEMMPVLRKIVLASQGEVDNVKTFALRPEIGWFITR